MTILILNYEYPPLGGGAANASLFMAREFKRLGHRVVVVTAAFQELRGFSEEDGIEIYRVRSLRKKMEGSNIVEMFAYVLASILPLKKILREVGPVDIALSFFTIPSGMLARYVKYKYGIEYVVSLRGGDVPGVDPDINFIHKILTPLRRNILKNARSIVANSEALKAMSEKTDPYPVAFIPNGVDCNFFQPVIRENPKRVRFIFVGRFQRQKNMFALLEAFSKLNQRHHGSAELYLVGDGYQKDELVSKCQEYKIESLVIFSGWLDKTKIRAAYNDSDCLVNPSIYEGMPNVVLEAMACGLPVIASNIPGNDLLVTDNENGLLFDLKQPAELVDAMETIVKDHELRRWMGKRGRATAESKFSWSKVAVDYLKLVSSK